MSVVKGKRYFETADGPHKKEGLKIERIDSVNKQRHAPEWALQDDKLSEVLLRVFPKLKTDRNQNKQAKTWATVIRKFYIGVSTGLIAAHLGVSNQTVCSILYRARHAAAGLRTDGRPRAPKRGRPKRASVDISVV